MANNIRIVKDEETEREGGRHWFDVYKDGAVGWFVSFLADDELDAWRIYRREKIPYLRYDHIDTNEIELPRDMGVVSQGYGSYRQDIRVFNLFWLRWREEYKKQGWKITEWDNPKP